MIRHPARKLDLIAAALVFSIAARNRWIDELAKEFAFTEKAMDFMLGGALEAILAAAIVALAWAERRTLAGALIMTACGLAIFEAVQRPICRALIPDMQKVPKGMDLCEHLTGLPISPSTGWMFFIIACVVIVVYAKRGA